jgi:hypothetical protein
MSSVNAADRLDYEKDRFPGPVVLPRADTAEGAALRKRLLISTEAFGLTPIHIVKMNAQAFHRISIWLRKIERIAEFRKIRLRARFSGAKHEAEGSHGAGRLDQY